jgi:Pyridoxamine 5'-phosphate oxidase
MVRSREAAAASLTSQAVWDTLARAWFAVVSHVTPAGQPRSSGVVYAATGHRLYAAVAADSWKARHIAANGRVALTVPVRRGGLLSLLFPIPPATISFHGIAIVHPADPAQAPALPQELVTLLPAERRATSCVLEIRPERQFVTYGLGVSLRQMRSPSAARSRVPAGTPAGTAA